ncbi:hypothetical protein ACPUEK_15955 [Marinomonas gallaica]|uniref:hypothetical protein n=1 Tax=Marinomonas gallaica TaxID=1806667 RepID=UPI003CE4D8A7
MNISDITSFLGSIPAAVWSLLPLAAIILITFNIYKKKGELDIFFCTLLASLFLILFIAYFYFIESKTKALHSDNIEKIAQFGDSFGVTTSFFSSFGTILLVITVALQYKTLESQKKQLQETHDEVREQKKTIEGQRQDAFFNIFMNEFNKIRGNLDIKISRDLTEPKKTFTNENKKTILNTVSFIEKSLEKIGINKGILSTLLSINETSTLIFFSTFNKESYLNISTFIEENLKNEKEKFIDSLSFPLYYTNPDRFIKQPPNIFSDETITEEEDSERNKFKEAINQMDEVEEKVKELKEKIIRHRIIFNSIYESQAEKDHFYRLTKKLKDSIKALNFNIENVYYSDSQVKLLNYHASLSYENLENEANRRLERFAKI